jgi:hypothetical protein
VLVNAEAAEPLQLIPPPLALVLFPEIVELLIVKELIPEEPLK